MKYRIVFYKQRDKSFKCFFTYYGIVRSDEIYKTDSDFSNKYYR